MPKQTALPCLDPIQQHLKADKDRDGLNWADFCLEQVLHFNSECFVFRSVDVVTFWSAAFPTNCEFQRCQSIALPIKCQVIAIISLTLHCCKNRR